MALAGLATPAAAQNLDLAEVGAALALPVITSWGDAGDTDTSIVITNTSGTAIKLGVQVISGDPNDSWNANSFDCVVTAHETTEFYYTAVPSQGNPGSEVRFECSEPDATADSPQRDLNIRRTEGPLHAQVGIMFVYASTISGAPSSNDVLVGEATVINYTHAYAYQVSAVPFQGGDSLAQNGDLRFNFDGLEYAQFPSVLTTNFFSENRWRSSFLILFTLDGTIGSETPVARVKINFYNDDERKRNAFHEFDCFTIVSLTDLDSRFVQSSLGSKTGHLSLAPEIITYPNLAHDAQFDGPQDGVRRTPVHGWLFAKVTAGICRNEGEEGEDAVCTRTGIAAWGKTLDQGTFSLDPVGRDRPTLNAQ